MVQISKKNKNFIGHEFTEHILNNHISRLRDLKEEHMNHMNKIISELEKEKEYSETRRIMRRNLQKN
jgi:hypothetical protein